MTSTTDRLAAILAKARYLAMSTVRDNGRPWTCNINYVVDPNSPGSLVFYSARSSDHIVHLRHQRNVSGAIYITEPELDGIQFTGEVAEVRAELIRIHKLYYESNFPNPSERVEWEMPVEAFEGDGLHRFYAIKVDAAWIIDLESWPTDKVDRRVELDLHLVWPNLRESPP